MRCDDQIYTNGYVLVARAKIYLEIMFFVEVLCFEIRIFSEQNFYSYGVYSYHAIIVYPSVFPQHCKSPPDNNISSIRWIQVLENQNYQYTPP